MRLELLPSQFAVCQLASLSEADLSIPNVFLARTEEEISLVCPISQVPAHSLRREDGWRCLKIAGPLDFSLVGVLAEVSSCLAARKIPLFALSTYNTDYILLKESYLTDAIEALRAAGHEIAPR